MKTGRKLIASMLAVLMLAGLLAFVPQTAEVRAAESTAINLEVTQVNPLYADVLGEKDLIQAHPSKLLADGEDVTYLTDEQEAAEIIREGMKNRQESIVVYFHMADYNKDDATAMITNMAANAMTHTGVPTEGDYLMWQYGGFEASAKGTLNDDNSADLAITYTYTYYTTAEEEAEVDTAVAELLEDLDVSGKTDYLKVKAIYDYICDNVEYDDEHSNDTKYTKQFTAYGALLDGTSVCQGYALLMYRLALELDVDCRLIAGKSKGEDHGWNIVELDDLYYNVDSTWDAGYKVYSWFLISEENFTNHLRSEEYDTEEFHTAYPMSEEDHCVHEYDKGTVTQEATCAVAGVKTYTCSICKETYTEEIATLAHTWNEGEVTSASTCVTQGTKKFTCTVCGGIENRKLDLADHTWDAGKITTEPTCTETGVKTFSCTVSGCEGTKTEAVEANGHSYESVVIEPTCTTEGYTRHTCSVCEDTYTDSTTPVTAHPCTTVTVAPSCTSEGYDQHTCNVCGYKYSDNYVAPLDHTFEDGICMDCGAKAVYRVYGSTRYETAFAVADTLKAELCVTQFSSIIVACGDNFADALSGSYLAAAKNAPILLTNGKNIDEILEYAENNLGTGGTVYLLGGTTAVSADVEKSLTDAKINVTRLSGKTRFDTNVAILNAAGIAANQEILICTGWDFADCLSASATGMPILLVNNTTGELTEAQIEFLNSVKGSKLTIIGGTGAVSEKLEKLLGEYGTVSRLYGANRYVTSVEVAKHYFKEPTSVVLTYAYNFPDGLCGGPLAYVTGAPLILTSTEHSEEAVEYATSLKITQGYVLGGISLISDETVRTVFDMAEDQYITTRS